MLIYGNIIDNSFFPFDQLETLKVMRVEQLHAGKMCGTNIRFKKKFLNYFLQEIFNPWM